MSIGYFSYALLSLRIFPSSFFGKFSFAPSIFLYNRPQKHKKHAFFELSLFAFKPSLKKTLARFWSQGIALLLNSILILSVWSFAVYFGRSKMEKIALWPKNYLLMRPSQKRLESLSLTKTNWKNLIPRLRAENN